LLARESPVFVEHASGVLVKRLALEEALDYLRPGDTLVVTKLDRLGRSVRNLKEVLDGLQVREVGLQGIDATTQVAGCSSTCSRRSPSSSTTCSLNAPRTASRPLGPAGVKAEAGSR
jgi:hypothetical protein